MRNLLEEQAMLQRMPDEELAARMQGGGDFNVMLGAVELSRRERMRAQAMVPESQTTVVEDQLARTQAPQQGIAQAAPQTAQAAPQGRAYGFGGLIQDHWMDGFSGVPGLQQVITGNSNSAAPETRIGINRYQVRPEEEEERSYASGGLVQEHRKYGGGGGIFDFDRYRDYGGMLGNTTAGMVELQKRLAEEQERERMIAEERVREEPLPPQMSALENLMQSEAYRNSSRPVSIPRVKARTIDPVEIGDERELIEEVDVADYDTDNFDRAVMFSRMAKGFSDNPNFIGGLADGTAEAASYNAQAMAERDKQLQAAQKNYQDRKDRAFEFDTSQSMATGRYNAEAQAAADAANMRAAGMEADDRRGQMSHQLAVLGVDAQNRRIAAQEERDRETALYREQQLMDRHAKAEADRELRALTLMTEEERKRYAANTGRIKAVGGIEQGIQNEYGRMARHEDKTDLGRYKVDTGAALKREALDQKESQFGRKLNADQYEFEGRLALDRDKLKDHGAKWGATLAQRKAEQKANEAFRQQEFGLGSEKQTHDQRMDLALLGIKQGDALLRNRKFTLDKDTALSARGIAEAKERREDQLHKYNVSMAELGTRELGQQISLEALKYEAILAGGTGDSKLDREILKQNGIKMRARSDEEKAAIKIATEMVENDFNLMSADQKEKDAVLKKNFESIMSNFSSSRNKQPNQAQRSASPQPEGQGQFIKTPKGLVFEVMPDGTRVYRP